MKHRLDSPLARMSRRIGFLATLVVVLLAVPCAGIARENAAPTDIHDTSTTTDPGRTLVTDPELWRTGPILVVSNTNEERNGMDWRPDALIADPGPDGISLREALASINSIATDPNQHETITFDPSLMGAVITTTIQLAFSKDGLTIDGDLDDDGVPDIIIEGQGAELSGLWIQGASNVIIEGIHFRNFGTVDLVGSGISVVNNVQDGSNDIENIVLRNNRITGGLQSAIDVRLWNTSHGSVRNLEIIGNTFQGYGTGVALLASEISGNSDNEISHVKIISNTFIGNGYTLGVTIRPVGMSGNHDSSRNLVDDIEIRSNTMSGHTNVSILVDAANRDKCHDNTVSNVVIAENVIDGTPVVIEIVSVGENGTNSTGNLVTNVAIVDNVLTGGGVQLSGATASGATGNTISNVVVERNHIAGCINNGFIAYAGDGGAQGNRVEDIIVRDNFIGYSTDVGILLDGLAYPLSLGNTIDDVTIANNTIVSNGIGSAWAGGLNINNKYVANVISNITISNTILWGNNFDDALHGTFDINEVIVAGSIISDTRFTGSNGNFYTDPRFVDPVTKDYHLQSTSPCVDAGDAGGTLVGPQDLDRRVRIWDGDGIGSAIVDCGAYEYGAPLMQEMAVYGNGLGGHGFGIPDGDPVPVPWDGTAFGSLRVAGETVTHAFAISNTGGLTLTLTGSPRVTITGTNAADFAVAIQPTSPIAAGGATTFTVVFDPSVRGLRSATVAIDNDDTDEHPYTFALQGIGTAPEIRLHWNDIAIDDGDTTPSEEDGTDFGTANTSGQYTDRSYFIYNTGTTTLTLTGTPAVTVTGQHAADFAVATQPGTTLAPATETGIWMHFTPQAAGLRSATVSIDNNDDDENPYTFAIQGTGVDLPEVAFSTPTFDVLENVGAATITVTLSATSTETVTVDYRTEQGNATACTGPGDCDYTPTQGQLTFDPGDTVATFGVDIVDDDLFELHVEGLQLTLENADNAIGTPTSADLGIEDNDDPPIVAFSAGTYAVGEDEGTAPITVTLQGQTAVTATVVISTTGGTATPGEDYAALHRTLVFTPGVTSQVVPVALADDVEIEGGETVLLALGEPQEAAVGTPAGATLEIADDDDLPVVAFSAGTYTAGEDEGTAPITVTLQGQTAVTATVVISTTGGTATPGADYVSVHRTLVFTPGVTSQVFTVSIVDDAIGEDDETVVLTLSEATNATIGTNNPALLTIIGGYEVYLPLVVR